MRTTKFDWLLQFCIKSDCSRAHFSVTYDLLKLYSEGAAFHVYLRTKLLGKTL